MDVLARITEQDFSGATGELPAGFLFASVKNVGREDVVVNGVPLAPGEAKSYPFVGKEYEAVPFEVNGAAQLRVMYIL